MSIIDLVALGTHALALDSTGCLLAWDISSSKHQTVPFLRSILHLPIATSPLSLMRTPTHVYVCSKQQIHIIHADTLQGLQLLEKAK